jgi:hypothetical protein
MANGHVGNLTNCANVLALHGVIDRVILVQA